MKIKILGTYRKNPGKGDSDVKKLGLMENLWQEEVAESNIGKHDKRNSRFEESWNKFVRKNLK